MALAADFTRQRRKVDVRGFEPAPQMAPMATSLTLFRGSLVCNSGSAGSPVFTKGATATGLVAIGIFTSPKTINGSSGTLEALAQPGVWLMTNSISDPVVATDVGNNCYIVDDDVVSHSNGGGTQSVCGIVVAVGPEGVWVLIGGY